MIQWAFLLFVLTLVSAPFAFGEVRPDVATVGRTFFAILGLLFVATASAALQQWRDRRRSRR